MKITIGKLKSLIKEASHGQFSHDDVLLTAVKYFQDDGFDPAAGKAVGWDLFMFPEDAQEFKMATDWENAARMIARQHNVNMDKFVEYMRNAVEGVAGTDLSETDQEYPDTESGAKEALKSMSDLNPSRIEKARAEHGPSVGIWYLYDVGTANEPDAIVYLMNHDPNQATNDFELGKLNRKRY